MTEIEPNLERALNGLLHPQRVAIIGASERMGFASSIQQVMMRAGYPGEILPVNPRYESVHGRKAYPSIDAIEGGVDLAFLVVPNRFVFDVLEQCERADVKAVNIISSGFAEKQEDTTGGERQSRLREFAERTGIRIVGPNNLGIISVPARLNGLSSPFDFPLNAGPVAVIFQSGLLIYSLVMPMHERGMGFTYIVSSGNEADLDAADYIRYYVNDNDTRIIACFLEQIRDPERFLEAVDLAAERQKPVVALKIGRSEKGRRSALAHTGSLVGADGIADAVLRQHGVTRVSTVDEMIETLAIFHTRRLPKGNGVASWFLSGGAAGLMSDVGEGLGISFPDLAPETYTKLEAVIPEYGTVGNPLDATGQVWAVDGGVEGVFTSLAEDPNLDVIVYGKAFPGQMDLHPESAEIPPDMPERFPDKIFIVLSLVSGRHREGKSFFEEQMAQPSDFYGDIPHLQSVDDGLRAIRSLLRYGEFQRGRAGAAAGSAPSANACAAREIVAASCGRPLVERDAKRVLALYGIPVTREALATDADAAARLAEQMGFPVVLKVESADIPHKTEAGGVLLNLASVGEVRDGFARIIANAKQHNPAAQVDGVLVQEMVGPGREMILGMSQDATFGPAVAVGLGGVFVETLKDIALGVPPLSSRDAEQMLERLRGYAILEGSGARGAGRADLPALIDTLQRFSRLCLDLADSVTEIDINPLRVFDAGQGVRVVDCLIVPAAASAAT